LKLLRFLKSLLLPLTACFTAAAIEIPPHQTPIILFNGSDLSQFDTFVKTKGLNSDPDHVFKVENGLIHVSGTEMGYIISKRSFEHFYLKAEFKWGEGTFAPKLGKARDSGILFHIQGPDKVWPRSVEFQVQEGGTGDFWMTDGASITGVDGKRATGPDGKAVRVDRIGKGPWQDVTGYRDPVGEVEKPHGEWNLLELVTEGNEVRQYVNGKLANKGTDPFPAQGKILFQSEGAEVFYRNIEIAPLR